MTESEVKQALLLNGKDVAMLTPDESNILTIAIDQGRKHGITITMSSEAPADALKRAISKQQYLEVVKQYPSRITVQQN